MSRRGKVWCVDQQARRNKKFVRKVTKALTPSKRTQRAIAKAVFSPVSSSSTSQANYKKKTSYKQTPVKWKYAKPTRKQLIVCFIIGVVCTYPVFANGNFDGSSASFFALLFFFYIPFSIALISVINYNKTKYQSYGPPEESKSKIEPVIPEIVEKPTHEEAIAEIDRINAKILMDEFQDSLSIMQKTTNPETFFSRYDLAMERLDGMAELQQKGIKFTSDLSSLKAQALSQETAADTVNVLIDNAYTKQLQKLSTLKTERGRANSNQRWYASFEPYFDKMPVRSRSYLDLKLEELKEV